MKFISKLGLALALHALILPIPALAHGRDSEDYDINRSNPHIAGGRECIHNQYIIKLKGGESKNSIARLRARAGKIVCNSSPLQNFFTENGLQEAEQLMALSGGEVALRPARAMNGKVVEDRDLSSLYVLTFNDEATTKNPNLLSELQALEDVEYAEPNYLVYFCVEPEKEDAEEEDPLYSQQWGSAAIGLDKLWEIEPTSDKKAIIAILDTGVDISHPDLEANIWTNEKEADGADNYDDDGNGFKDDLHGWDFVNQSPKIRDNNGHGTHCAGTAAAVGSNGVGIRGANPDAQIMPLTVLQSNGTGDVATIIKALDYARANGADVISMSFGTYTESKALYDALAKAYQKSVLVAAAGNDNLCINQHFCPTNKIFGVPMFPAAYNFVLGVEASCDNAGNLASFSNYDDDGAVTSKYSDLYNYELRAPGIGIISTFPNGQYRALNGTSMACPLMAGAISRLLSVKEYSSKEELFGDLIHTSKGNIDIFAAYSLNDADRTPSLDLVTYRMDDSKMGDGDGRPDAGETLRVYPTFRNSWGIAKNIKYRIRLSETEDPDILEFIDNGEAHSLSNLSSYATVEAEYPFIIKISSDCADGRIICLELVATCENISDELVVPIDMTIENGVELGGVLSEDMTLTPDKNYIVTSNIAIQEGVTLTIKPGTKLKFRDRTGIRIAPSKYEYSDSILNNGEHWHYQIYKNPGKVIAKGEPGKTIEFTTIDGARYSYYVDFSFSPNSIIEYCDFNSFYDSTIDITTLKVGKYYCNDGRIEPVLIGDGICRNNIIHNMYHMCKCYIGQQWIKYNDTYQVGYNNIYDIDDGSFLYTSNTISNSPYNNFINNNGGQYGNVPFNCSSDILSINAFSNGKNKNISFALYCENPLLVHTDPLYLGTSRTDFMSKNILDIRQNYMYGELDLSNMRTRPYSEAHGIVWKVVVNDYDAQDEYDWLAPLGVGRHKFEVYFNRKMNHKKTPMITMGVREPYTQAPIAEDGSWRTETFDGEDVDIYTAYLTIQGKDNFDGVNTICVAEAEDDEFFEIPIEDVRFHVNVQSAGSMSNGFEAEAGVGKVTLTWENPEDNFDDMLGYNMYRYTLDAEGNPTEAQRINDSLLTEETLIDYDIVPGTTYCYYYKVLRTSMTENSASKIVAATPRAAGKGDANGSGDVDVADVVTEVSYMVGRNPKPFIFDAADVNDDQSVDILDVVGTVNLIMKKSPAESASVQSSAQYWIEDDCLYIDSPVELGGVQVEINGNIETTEISPLQSLKGMETSGDWVSNDAYRFLAFSMTGKTIPTGITPLLNIKDGGVAELKLSDIDGKNVIAMKAENTGISSIIGHQMLLPYPNPFSENLNVTLRSVAANDNVALSLVTIDGKVVMTKNLVADCNDQPVTLDTRNLATGMYMLILSVDGNVIQTVKVIKK